MNTNDGYTLSKTKLLLISLGCFVLGFLCCEYIFHKEEYEYRNTLTEFDLGENEYSDGIIAFKCPKEFTCQASGDQSFPTMHVITSDTADYSKFTEATIEGDFQFTMNNEKCLITWYMYHEKDTQKTGFQDMKETITEKGNKKIFEKKIKSSIKTFLNLVKDSLVHISDLDMDKFHKTFLDKGNTLLKNIIDMLLAKGVDDIIDKGVLVSMYIISALMMTELFLLVKISILKMANKI